MRNHIKTLLFKFRWLFLMPRRRYACLCQRSGFYK